MNEPTATKQLTLLKPHESRAGLFIAFYSYKGGVGRTQAIADVGVILAQLGRRVLLIDWDLEAPGLDAYLRPVLGQRLPQPGLLEVVSTFEQCPPNEVSRYVHVAQGSWLDDRLHFLPAGGALRRAQQLQRINWDELYERGFGNWLEDLRSHFSRDYDFILIDSRTGISDIGGICTIHLPDMLVTLFTPNEQSLRGASSAADAAIREQKKLPIDRANLQVVPVPTRIDNSEQALSKAWMQRIITLFGPFVDRWAEHPQHTPRILQELSVPYIPFWSFGEEVPALSSGGSQPRDRRSVEYAHESLALLLANQLMDTGTWLDNRSTLKASLANPTTNPSELPVRYNAGELANEMPPLLVEVPSERPIESLVGLFRLNLYGDSGLSRRGREELVLMAVTLALHGLEQLLLWMVFWSVVGDMGLDLGGSFLSVVLGVGLGLVTAGIFVLVDRRILVADPGRGHKRLIFLLAVLFRVGLSVAVNFAAVAPWSLMLLVEPINKRAHVEQVIETVVKTVRRYNTQESLPVDVRDYIQELRSLAPHEALPPRLVSNKPAPGFSPREYSLFERLRVLDDLFSGHPPRWPEHRSTDSFLWQQYSFPPPADVSEQPDMLDLSRAKGYVDAYWVLFSLSLLPHLLLLLNKFLLSRDLKRYFAQEST